MKNIYIKKNIFVVAMMFNGNNINDIKKMLGDNHDVQFLNNNNDVLWVDDKIVGKGMFVTKDKEGDVDVYSEIEFYNKFRKLRR